MDKIIERDHHLVEMNQKLREKLTQRIEVIKSVLDRDYDELMEDIKNKTKQMLNYLSFTYILVIDAYVEFV